MRQRPSQSTADLPTSRGDEDVHQAQPRRPISGAQLTQMILSAVQRRGEWKPRNPDIQYYLKRFRENATQGTAGRHYLRAVERWKDFPFVLAINGIKNDAAMEALVLHCRELMSAIDLDDEEGDRKFLTISQVAEILGCSYGEARERMLDGRIRTMKDGRWYRSRREWIEEYISKQTLSPPQTGEAPARAPRRKVTGSVKSGGIGHRFLQSRST